jgi:Gly-Xaa carboxypeptidase
MNTPRHDLGCPDNKHIPLPIARYTGYGLGQCHKTQSRRRRFLPWAVLVAVLGLALVISLCSSFAPANTGIKHVFPFLSDPKDVPHYSNQLCAQETALEPAHDLYEKLGHIFNTSKFRDHTIGLHSGAVQIPTESDNQMGDVGEDRRWEAFGPFHD